MSLSHSTGPPKVVVNVKYVTDPKNAKAAQDILTEGFRRALSHIIHEKSQKEKNDGVA